MRSCRQASPSSAQPSPDAWSARREHWLCHYIADQDTVLEIAMYRSWLRSLFSEKPRNRAKCRPQRIRPQVETLEDRLVPTAVFQPVFGVETEKSDGMVRLYQPEIFLIFW